MKLSELLRLKYNGPISLTCPDFKLGGSRVQYFLDVAKTVASQSTCRKKVGAIIVDPDTKYIVSTGYCGAPAGTLSCKERGGCYREKHHVPSGTDYDTKCISVHAEQNAILQAGIKNTQGCYLFMWGQPFLCTWCKRFCIQAGLGAVVIQADDSATDPEVEFIRDYREEINSMLYNGPTWQ